MYVFTDDYVFLLWLVLFVTLVGNSMQAIKLFEAKFIHISNSLLYILH